MSGSIFRSALELVNERLHFDKTHFVHEPQAIGALQSAGYLSDNYKLKGNFIFLSIQPNPDLKFNEADSRNLLRFIHLSIEVSAYIDNNNNERDLLLTILTKLDALKTTMEIDLYTSSVGSTTSPYTRIFFYQEKYLRMHQSLHIYAFDNFKLSICPDYSSHLMKYKYIEIPDINMGQSIELVGHSKSLLSKITGFFMAPVYNDSK